MTPSIHKYLVPLLLLIAGVFIPFLLGTTIYLCDSHPVSHEDYGAPVYLATATTWHKDLSTTTAIHLRPLGFLFYVLIPAITAFFSGKLWPKKEFRQDRQSNSDHF